VTGEHEPCTQQRIFLTGEFFSRGSRRIVYLIKQFKQGGQSELDIDRSYTVIHALCTDEIEIEKQAVEAGIEAGTETAPSIAELGMRARSFDALTSEQGRHFWVGRTLIANSPHCAVQGIEPPMFLKTASKSTSAGDAFPCGIRIR